jgi:hypothetical protein
LSGVAVSAREQVRGSPLSVDAKRTTIPSSAVRIGVPLVGIIDGVNVVFATVEPFVNVPPRTIALYLNGVRLSESAGDYASSESGGPGTGYDTVTLIEAPRAGDVLRADFVTT